MRRRSQRRSRGAVLVEYAFLLVAFGIPVVMGLTAGGVRMLRNYQEARAHILRTLP